MPSSAASLGTVCGFNQHTEGGWCESSLTYSGIDVEHNLTASLELRPCEKHYGVECINGSGRVIWWDQTLGDMYVNPLFFTSGSGMIYLRNLAVHITCIRRPNVYDFWKCGEAVIHEVSGAI